jgi:aromatic-L-amino-acid decarboxylase
MAENIRDYLSKVLDLIESNELGREQVLPTNRVAKIRSALDTKFPKYGQDFPSILKDLEDQVLPFLNRNTDSRYAAFITGSGNPIGAIAEYIKGHYNQNSLKWNSSPIASELERLVIHWIAAFIDQPAFNIGFLTSSGSMSNFLAVHFAFAAAFPNREMEGIYGIPRVRVYGSDQTHSSVERALVFLGIGRDNLVEIPVNDQFEIQVDVLRAAIKKDKESGYHPLMVIGNAGTTNTGSIDDLNALAEVAAEFKLWYHVDGAYGLPAIRLPQLKAAFLGTAAADSITVNPHKWMYVPFEASSILLKEMPQAINFAPAYLQDDAKDRWESSSQTVELSKEFRALKVWFTLKYYGVEQLVNFIRQDIELVQYMAGLLSATHLFVVEPCHPLSILCFRIHSDDLLESENEKRNIDAVKTIESEGKYFLTGTKLRGQTYLRVYFGNPNRTRKDVDALVKYLVSLSQSLA